MNACFWPLFLTYSVCSGTPNFGLHSMEQTPPVPAMDAAGELPDTIPEEGEDRESNWDRSYEEEPTTDSEGSHLVSLGSHRHRRAHAVCD